MTGASGFVGTNVVVALAARGWAVVGSGRGAKPPALPVEAWLPGDLLASGVAHDVMREARPTHVIHAVGALGGGARDRRELFDAHALSTAALLEAVAVHRPDAWVAVAGSSAVYGRAPLQPIPESAPMAPLSDYATSKCAQELVAAQYRGAGLSCSVARFFNLVGPGQSDVLLLSSLAHQAAEQEQDPDRVILLRVGNLEPRRDYLDVRDAARAVVALAEARCDAPAVNVGSGRSWSVSDCVDMLATALARPLRLTVDAVRKRALDIDDQRADLTLLRSLVDWSPEIDLLRSVSDLLDHWRSRVAQGVRA